MLSTALWLLCVSHGNAQEITATISGTVTDQAGGLVAGASIIVVSVDQAITVRRRTTSNDGNTWRHCWQEHCMPKGLGVRYRSSGRSKWKSRLT